MSNIQNTNNGAQNTAQTGASLKLTASSFNPTKGSELKVGSSSFTPSLDAPAFIPGGQSSAPSFNASSFYPAAQAAPVQPVAQSFGSYNTNAATFQPQANTAASGYGYDNQTQSYGNTGGYNQNYQGSGGYNNSYNQGGYQGQQSYGQNQGYGGNNFNQSYSQQAQPPAPAMYNNQGGSYNSGYNSYKPQPQFQQKQSYNNYNQSSGGYNAGAQSFKPAAATQGYNGQAQTQYKPKQQYNSGGYNQNSTGSGGYSNWENSSFQPNLNANKVKNVPTATQPSAMSMSVAAKPFTFTTFTPTPADHVKDSLKKHGVSDEEDVKSFKTLLADLKKHFEENKDGVISLDLFKKVGATKICDSKESKYTEDSLVKSVNIPLVDREVKESIEGQTKMKKNYSQHNKGGGKGYNQGYNQGEGNDFAKGTAQKDRKYNNNNNSGGTWKKEDNEEKAKLRELAQAQIARIRGDKNETQKIKLILNVIAPDNFNKKFGELRGFLFRGLKTQEECDEEGIDYNEDEHKLTDGGDQIDEVILDTIVQNIFRKAQLEKEYTIFYGMICEDTIKLELQLRGQSAAKANMKNSMFRKSLFEVCKQCFEKFFDSEERTKQMTNPDTAVLFKTKLFGNIDFVGELYRRKLLPHATLISVFQSLLGISENTIDDLVLEGAINLMNKVGQSFEEQAKNPGKKQKENQESFDEVIKRFDEIMNFQDEKIISNRIKILIKNMFSNREDGWAKSAEMNKGGPKTKIEIQMEVEKKYKDEQAARDRNQGGGGRYGDRKDGYNNRDNNNRDRRDGGNRNNDGYNDGGGRRNTENRYQKKDTQGGTYGKGGRENRNERDNRDRRQSVKEAPKIIELDDEEMAAQLKKNFEEYAAQGVEDHEEEVEDTKPEDKKFDLSIYDKLKSENGKTGPTIFFNLLCKVFDEEMQKVDLHFDGYMSQIISQKKLQSKDFSEGLSKFVQFMPEIVLDLPQIHAYCFKFVIRPLQKKGLLKMRFIKWSVDPKDKPAEVDPDDYVFDQTNSYYQLMALILKDFKNDPTVEVSWADTFTQYEKELNGPATSKEKFEKIEDPDDLWPAITAEIGEKDAKVIIPLLKGDMAAAKKAAA